MVLEVLADVRLMQTFEEKSALCYVYLHLCKVNMQLFKEKGVLVALGHQAMTTPCTFTRRCLSQTQSGRSAAPAVDVQISC